ncbi:uncharacterized protein LOC124910373 [Impatiens glandulifera]|uniref:uncharacterized protein LOC124910373 n=1 Tax=Impatiens glandulifera TaxID=253017 RepID=UPI001FB15405|nr:uncharacterized protein LOC124910373 [Impatiens glandulifera]
MEFLFVKKKKKKGLMVTILIMIMISILLMDEARAAKVTCKSKSSKCYYKQVQCPSECPTPYPSDPHAKVCFINCNSPICKAECKNRKANCNGVGAACLDPRFIGADGIVFYFHGKINQQFALVSDAHLQINGRFIGVRPADRPRDFTWIQALGILLADSRHNFSVDATRAESWDQEVDHLKFTYNGQELALPEGYPSVWRSPDDDNIIVERISDTNAALITLPEIAEISVSAVPITEEDNRVHNYRIPVDDCFAHLEVQFRFYRLSDNVEGVLGRTYQPDFKNPAKPGVAMPVVGGEDKYRTSSLLSSDCASCIYSPHIINTNTTTSMLMVDYGALDCTGKAAAAGHGIVCRK